MGVVVESSVEIISVPTVGLSVRVGEDSFILSDTFLSNGIFSGNVMCHVFCASGATTD